MRTNDALTDARAGVGGPTTTGTFRREQLDAADRGAVDTWAFVSWSLAGFDALIASVGGTVVVSVADLVEASATPRLVGYVTEGPASGGDVAGLGEIWAVYVDPVAQGRGVGRALMDAGVRGLMARGFREAILWVFEANATARGFYERMGWTPDGAAKPFAIGGAAPIELRYRRRLR